VETFPFERQKMEEKTERIVSGRRGTVISFRKFDAIGHFGVNLNRLGPKLV